MSIEIVTLNHIGLVVKDEARAKEFYVGIIGLQYHEEVSSWLHLNEHILLHLIEIPEATADKSIYHEVQHFAVQVKSLDAALKVLIDNGVKPFQMSFQGEIKQVTSREDRLDFGIGTLFVEDPDGNLVEFLEFGKGKFSEM